MPENLEKEIAVAEKKADVMLKELEKMEKRPETLKYFKNPEERVCIDKETLEEIKTVVKNYESEGGDISQYKKVLTLLKKK